MRASVSVGQSMKVRAFMTFAFVATIMAGAARATPPSPIGGPDGGVVRESGPDSDAIYAAILMQPFLPEDEAQLTSPDTAEPAQPLLAQDAPRTPGDIARFKTPALPPKDVLEAPDPGAVDGSPRLPIQKLPAYSVLGTHIHIFRERDIYSRAGMIDQSFKRHPGLLVGDEFKLNEDAAHEMFLDDDWRSTKSDYGNMAQAMELGGDRLEGRMILQDVNDADLIVRDDAEDDDDQPSTAQFRLGQLGGDSKLVEVPAIPFDVTVLRMKW